MEKILISIMIASCLYTAACVPLTHRIYQKHTYPGNPAPLATDILQGKFDTSKRVLQILEIATDCLDDGKTVSKETFSEIIEVISKFTDKCHQEMEDKILFPFLKDVSDGEKKDFLGQLLMEHVSARDMIRDLSEAVNKIYLGKKAKKKLTKIARAYIRFMDKHIRTEEKLLFPWINKILTSDEQVILIGKFEEMEKEYIDAGIHKKYTVMIERLEDQFREQ